MEIGAVKLTERELIKHVVLKRIPIEWTLDLKRANYNLGSLTALRSAMKPIEGADESEHEHENSLTN